MSTEKTVVSYSTDKIVIVCMVLFMFWFFTISWIKERFDTLEKDVATIRTVLIMRNTVSADIDIAKN